MDVIVVIIVLAALAVIIFKKFSNFVYFMAIIDIFLRLLNFLTIHLKLDFLTDFLNKYFPNNLEHMITMYSSGIFTTVLLWLLWALYAIFIYYLVKIFLKKK